MVTGTFEVEHTAATDKLERDKFKVNYATIDCFAANVKTRRV